MTLKMIRMQALQWKDSGNRTPGTCELNIPQGLHLFIGHHHHHHHHHHGHHGKDHVHHGYHHHGHAITTTNLIQHPPPFMELFLVPKKFTD